MKAPLTEREWEVARLLADGESWKRVADALGITEHTVRAHVDRIYQKIRGRGRKSIAIANFYTRHRLSLN